MTPRSLPPNLQTTEVSAIAPGARPAAIMIDGSRLADEFQGIGALKQGGQQRGIYDYEEPQRQEIMDFLFAGNDPLSGTGAAFQSLKIEIGGDGYSGEAAEPSFAHTRAELGGPYRYRGDTWWWMWQARLRNRSIPIIALAWGIPGWVGDTLPAASSQDKYFSRENIDYLTRFLLCARDADTGIDGPSLAVQYLGIWNETRYDGHEEWIYDLKRRLAAEDLDVMLVGADLGVNPDPDPLPAMYAARAECARASNVCHAFDVLGVHYPGAGGSSWSHDDPPLPMLQTRAPTAAEVAFSRSSGKALWSSEDAASGILAFAEGATTRLLGEWYGALKLAHLLNTNYIYGRYVHTDVLFFANGMMSDVLYAPGAGLLSANRPWDGHFDIQPGLWAVAHTTQFALPGWRYVETACGGLTQSGMECVHDATSEGSYVTLSDGVDYSIVVETKGAPAPVTREFVVRNLPRAPVHVWLSDEQEQLREAPPGLDTSSGQFSYTFEPNRIYTLTTTSGQGRQTPTRSLPQRRFPDPYVEDFASYGVIDDSGPGGRTVPRLITTQEGSFELVPTSSGGNQKVCLEQKVSQPTNEWPAPWSFVHPGQRFGTPHALFGDDNWTNYEVSAAVCFTTADGVSSVSLLGRLQVGASDGWDFQRRRHYELRVTKSGDVSIIKHSFDEGVVTEHVAAGPTKLGPLNARWFSLRFRFDGYAVEGYVDGSITPTVRFVDASQDPAAPPFLHGPAGIGTGWNTAMFENVTVASLAETVTTFDDEDLAFDRRDAWLSRACPGDELAYDDTLTSSNSPGDTATFTFTGTGVVVFGAKAQNGGRARITVDGRQAADVDFFREARAIGQQVVYVSPQLGHGLHTLAIEVLGSGQPGQTNLGAGVNYVHLDRVDVIP